MFPLSATLSLQVFEALFSPLRSTVYNIVSKNDMPPSTVHIEISGGPLTVLLSYFISSNCENL